MRPIKITPENLPTDTPAMIGTRYFCREWDCYTERKDLKECGVIPSGKATYTPILRCSICGRLYFGNPAPIPANEEATTARAQAEEERKALIRADEEATRAEMQKTEAEQRGIERAEREAHEAKQTNDIILPHLLTV